MYYYFNMKWTSRFMNIFKRYNNGAHNNNLTIHIKKYYTKNEVNNKKRSDYILSLDEALYLSKEMDIKTTTEIQKIIMRSPPFSPDRSPFVIENFLSNIKNENDLDELSSINKKIKDLEEKGDDEKKEDSLENTDTNQYLNKNNDDIINKFLINSFNKKRGKTFIHDNKEWLEESEGIGTNKRSCAYVYLKRGSGIVKINNEEDLYIRWPYFYNRIDVIEPFYLTNTACVYDVFIKLKGGGISGQSKAARLAIGRALLNACPLIYNDLVQHDILYEDMRQKFPKMPGRKKSRAMKQWSKR